MIRNWRRENKNQATKIAAKKNFIKANIANKIYVANLNTSKQQHHQAGENRIIIKEGVKTKRL